MEIEFWGVRGSIAAPTSNEEYKEKIFNILVKSVESGLKDVKGVKKFIKTLPPHLQNIYGGNTTCVSVKSSSGKIYILDAGTGIRLLGSELLKGDCGKGKGEVNIFFTHNHWDHIQGFPFFVPLFIPGNIINIYSPYKTQQDVFRKQMSAPFFPVKFDETLSVKNFITLNLKKSIKLEDNLTVDFYPLNHPCGSIAYKFTEGDKSFIFATDVEFTGEIFDKKNNDKFFENTNYLMIDSQYTLEESFAKMGWGHSSVTMAVNCGVKWNVKNLILTHHEPTNSDMDLWELYGSALKHSKDMDNKKMKITMAREGMKIKI